MGLPTIGIHVGWDIIPLDSKVETISEKTAWETLLRSTPPWFKTPQTFNQLRESQNSDYQQIVKEETENGKVDYYRSNGLEEPYFCIFANIDGSFMLLGDGNHRLLDCIHLINAEKKNFDMNFEKTQIDIIYLTNFEQVLIPNVIWGENWK